MAKQIELECPYDDCEAKILIPKDSEEADVIVCRRESDAGIQGCNRNVEIMSLEKDVDGNITKAEITTLEVDEDWGE